VKLLSPAFSRESRVQLLEGFSNGVRRHTQSREYLLWHIFFLLANLAFPNFFQSMD